MNFRFERMYDRYEMEVHTGNFDLVVWVYRLSYRLEELRRAWRNFKGPCPDCGRKWGKHDENMEHPPF